MKSPSIGKYFTDFRWPFGRHYEHHSETIGSTYRNAITGQTETVTSAAIGLPIKVWDQREIDIFWGKVLKSIFMIAVIAGLITGGYYLYPYLNNKE